MKHVRCIKCNIPISKIQRDSHSNMCGSCFLSYDTTDKAKGILLKLQQFKRSLFHG